MQAASHRSTGQLVVKVTAGIFKRLVQTDNTPIKQTSLMAH
jgi:hypothetical protein